MIFLPQNSQNLLLPRDYPSTLVWLDGSDPNNTSSLPTNNSNISSWKNKSKIAVDFSQPTGASQPKNINNFRNGKNCVQFTQAPTFMTSDFNIDFTPNFSLLFAVQFTSVATGYIIDLASFTTPEIFVNVNSGSLKVGVWNGSADKGAVTATVTTGVFYLVVYTYDSTGTGLGSMWVNGVSAGSTANSGYSAFGSYVREIGSTPSSVSFGGYLGDIVWSSGVWTTQERLALQLWAATKWGIALP